MRCPYRLLLVLIALLLCSSSGQAQGHAPITILTPGDSSLVTRSIDIQAMVYPGEDGLIRVSLVDRNQNILARQLLRVDAPADSPIEFMTSLAFEIPTETSTAILTIATQDHLHRPLALRSVTLTLVSSGSAKIEPAVSSDDWLVLTAPQPSALIRGSPLQIAGTVIPLNSNPVIFELLTEGGGAVISKQLPVETPGEAIVFDFSLSLPPFTIDRDMRLVIRQSAGMGGVDAILDSLPIVFSP